jgi:hypothetical protein
VIWRFINIYEVVGLVKPKKNAHFSFLVGRAVKGAWRLAFISTLDSPPNHTIEQGTKRNEVQWSFVP